MSNSIVPDELILIKSNAILKLMQEKINTTKKEIKKGITYSPEGFRNQTKLEYLQFLYNDKKQGNKKIQKRIEENNGTI